MGDEPADEGQVGIDPEFFEKMEEMANKLMKQPGVSEVLQKLEAAPEVHAPTLLIQHLAINKLIGQLKAVEGFLDDVVSPMVAAHFKDQLEDIIAKKAGAAPNGDSPTPSNGSGSYEPTGYV
jgi:hypothetical protein